MLDQRRIILQYFNVAYCDFFLNYGMCNGILSLCGLDCLFID